MTNQFTGQVVAITGATSGIGEATAHHFAQLGATVVGCGLAASLDAARQAWNVNGWRGRLSAVDVTDEHAVAAWLADSGEEFGGVDVLVTAAGIQRYASAAETSAELWDEVMAVNVRGCLFAAKHAIPMMRRRRGGCVIAVSSVQAFVSQTRVAAYAASKGALNALIRSIAIDEAPYGIRAIAVCPASVDTPMLRASARLFGGDSDEQAQRLLREWGSMHPLGRVATAGDVAGVIANLAGPHSAFVTGVAVPVDGGMLASVPVVLP